MTANQNPEQKARDHIDALLSQAGWTVQHNKKIDLNAGLGQAVREYQTDVGPADYVLFVDKKAVGVIEAKRAEQGHNITAVEEQTEAYASAKLKWVNNQQPLPFLYESTGILTRLTDCRDPRPRSREVFSINTEEIQSLVATCSIEEQKQIQMEIETRLLEVDQLELTTTSLQQAEALRQSILKKAFSGQLVPQDPHDEPASALLARIQAEKMQHAHESKKPLSRGKRNG